jgi:hypothetical protein
MLATIAVLGFLVLDVGLVVAALYWLGEQREAMERRPKRPDRWR